MSTKYSKNRAMKPLTIEDGDKVRVYKGQKLAAQPLLFETWKLIKVMLPAGASFADSMSQESVLELPQTWTIAAQMLESNLTEEHFADLVEKLTGELICNGEAISDWDAHFDEYIYDLPKVIAWAGEENFYDFFTRNHLVLSFWTKMKGKVEPMVKNLFSKMQTGSEDKSSDTNEENGSDI